MNSDTSILASKGKVGYTITQTATGNYRINFAQAHPAGVHYVIQLTATTAYYWVDQSTMTASSFLIALRGTNFAAQNGVFFFSVLA